MLKRRPFFIPPKETIRINEFIRVSEVRAVDYDGAQLGVIPTYQAMEKAKERGLDLVEVSPNSAPPVCRIMDFGKYKYEIAKKQKASKAKQHIIKVKEIKFHPKTGENDYNYRLVQAKEFLDKGFKVKATVVFRGREMAHLDYGARWLKKMTVDLNGVGVAETNTMVEGRNATVIFAPSKVAVKPKKVEVKPATESVKSVSTPAATTAEVVEAKEEVSEV